MSDTVEILKNPKTSKCIILESMVLRVTCLGFGVYWGKRGHGKDFGQGLPVEN